MRAATLHRDAARVDRIKLRYRSRPLPATIADSPAAGAHDRLRIDLAEPVLGATPGQAAVLMDGDVVVGTATIA